MEVIIPTHHDFDFNSARSSPHVSPPSTPKPFGGSNYYFSAPTSPSHLSQVIYDHRNFHDVEEAVDSNNQQQGSDDFAFDVAGDDWESSSVSAEDLFQGGVIKPLNNHRPVYIDSSKSVRNPLANTEMRAGRRERQHSQRSAAAPRSARSLSPARKSRPTHLESTVCSVLTTVKGGAGGSNSKKWSFKDLFLFRSASEGRASDKDPLKKYTEAVLRSTGSRRRGGPAPPVSPHERHYTVNRAVSEDMKKKTFLPYKQGILGRLAFNPAVHALANGFGFSRK